MKFKKWPFILFILAFVASLSFGTLRAIGTLTEIDRDPTENTGEHFRMRVAHGGSEAMLTHQALEVFKEYVETNSNGQIQVDIFPSGQLGGESTVISSLRTGDIEMTVVNTAALVPFTPKLNVMALPFAFPNHQVAYEVLDGEFGQYVSAMLEDEMGVVGLGFWDALDFRQLTSNRPIHSPEDLRGLRIRTMENPIQLAIWNELGASPTPIAFAELYTSLQQGTVDAQENPLELVTMMRFHEVQDYVTLTNHLFQTGQAIMSPRFYHSLPVDLQAVVRNGVQAGIDFQRATFGENYQRFIDILNESGTVIIEPTDQDRQMFVDNTSGVYASIRIQVGGDLMDRFHHAVQAAINNQE